MAAPQPLGNAGPAPRLLRFGAYEWDEATGELKKHGATLKLQGKPRQVLEALLERPGQVVTREELRGRLWPADVFIDVESGLNTAANRLRIALGDSAENPRYIETLARAGYRFIAPIEVVPPPKAAAAPIAMRRRRPAVPRVLLFIVAALALTV